MGTDEREGNGERRGAVVEVNLRRIGVDVVVDGLVVLQYLRDDEVLPVGVFLPLDHAVHVDPAVAGLVVRVGVDVDFHDFVFRELRMAGDVDGDVEEAWPLRDRDLVDVRAVGVADGIREIGGSAHPRQKERGTGDRDPGRKTHRGVLYPRSLEVAS
jgi:hypothetical protein